MDGQIDLLERRIAALEQKILPVNVGDKMTKPFRTVTEMLTQIHTLISSAISCRDVVKSVLDRMAELNTYLDPNYHETGADASAKKQFVITVQSEIKNHAEMIDRLKLLMPLLNSRPLINALDSAPKLDQLAVDNLELQREGEEIEKKIVEALQQYNDIIQSISRTFVHLEETVTKLEMTRKPKAKRV